MKISIFTSGWMRRNTIVSCVLSMMIACPSTPVFAADKPSPDAALLEFLGGSVRVGRDLVDPISLQSMQDETARHRATRTDSSSTRSDGKSAHDSKHRRSVHE